MQIAIHTCGQYIARHAAGQYTATAADDRRISSCPNCGGKLADDYLHDARTGRRVKPDDDRR